MKDVVLLFLLPFAFMMNVFELVFSLFRWLLSSDYRKRCVERCASIAEYERKQFEFTPEERERMLTPSGTGYYSKEELDFDEDILLIDESLKDCTV